MFKSFWSLFVGETLAVKQEKGNRHDRFAVVVIWRQSRPAMKLNEFASCVQSYKCLLTMNTIIAHETQFG